MLFRSQTHRAADFLLIWSAYGRAPHASAGLSGWSSPLSSLRRLGARLLPPSSAVKCACAQDEARAWAREGRPLIFLVWAGRKLRGPPHTGHWMATAASGAGAGDREAKTRAAHEQSSHEFWLVLRTLEPLYARTCGPCGAWQTSRGLE